MAKYRSKEIVHAEQYRPGMEDDFFHTQNKKTPIVYATEDKEDFDYLTDTWYPVQAPTDYIISHSDGTWSVMGHIMEPRAWSLKGGNSGQVKTEDPFRHCPNCDLWVPRSKSQCPRCQHIFEVASYQPEPARRVEFVEVKPDMSHPMHREYIRLLKLAKKKNYKAGWAYYRCLEKFNHEEFHQALTRADSSEYQSQFYYGA